MIKRAAALLAGGAQILSLAASMPTVSAASAKQITLTILTDSRYAYKSIIDKNSIDAKVSAYIENADDTKISSVKLDFTSSNTNSYFHDMTDPFNDKAAEEQLYKNSFGEFETKLPVYCFGKVTQKNGSLVYSNSGGTGHTGSKADDGVFGSTVYSDGAGGFYFTVEGYTDDGKTYFTKKYSTDYGTVFTGAETGKIQTRQLEDGRYQLKFHYTDRLTDPDTKEDLYYDKVQITTLNYSGRPLEKGQALPGNSDHFEWQSLEQGGSVAICSGRDIPLAQTYLNISKSEGYNDIKVGAENVEIRAADGTVYSVARGNLIVNETAISPVDSVTVTNHSELTGLYNNEADSIVNCRDCVGSFTADIVADGVKRSVNITPDVYGGGNNGTGGENAICYADDLYIPDFPYTEYDFVFCYSNIILKDVNRNGIVGKCLVGLKGDANLDGKVDSSDATAILIYYANKLSGAEAKLKQENSAEEERLAYFLADIDTESRNMGASGGAVDATDATAILIYYAELILNGTADWK